MPSTARCPSSVRRSSPNFSRDLPKLVDHDVEDALVAGEQVLQVRDLRAQLLELVQHLLALHGRERAQPHVEDRLGLALGELEALHQLLARLGGVLEARISAITSSRLSRAIAKPSSMCARASAWARS